MSSSNKTRLIILAGLAASLLIIAVLVISTAGRIGKTPVSLNTFPEDTRITINDRPVKSGTSYLKPGTYSIKASKEGFADYTKTLVLEKKEQTVVIILTPVSDEAKRWVKDNEAGYNKIVGVAEQANFENGKDFHSRNPIAKDLPYKNFLYSIGYRMDPSDPSGNSIIIEIDASEGYRQAALYRIRQLGYDPTDFTINFRDYTNPFSL